MILRQGETTDAAMLAAFAREHLSSYQVPVHFVFVDDFPRTPSLKPALADVARMIADAIEPG